MPLVHQALLKKWDHDQAAAKYDCAGADKELRQLGKQQDEARPGMTSQLAMDKLSAMSTMCVMATPDHLATAAATAPSKVPAIGKSSPRRRPYGVPSVTALRAQLYQVAIQLIDAPMIGPVMQPPGIDVRPAERRDAETIAAIYAPIVRDTAISFETEPPTPEIMAGRIEGVQRQHPWLVATVADKVVGYAYASEHRQRAAYRWSVDVSAYVDGNVRGKALTDASMAP